MPTPPSVTVQKPIPIATRSYSGSSLTLMRDAKERGDQGFGSTGQPEWLTTQPVWVPQWPLKEKLEAIKILVQEQLIQGHIELSTSPWNSPIFVIKKKSEKWRLLHDLRKINAVMESMGALQPGMPSPTMIPVSWDILIVDLKDRLFTIPLHPDDAPKFPFAVLSINNTAPGQRYQWRVLPQGMQNSPVICQEYVAQTVSSVREQFPGAYCYHYMDDILVATQTKEELTEIKPSLLKALKTFGLQIAPEKVQQQAPWEYLALKILDQTIQPQTIQFSTKIETLNDAQKLLGSINWVKQYLRLTDSQLAPLFDLLKGNPELTSPSKLNAKAKAALEIVEQAITKKQVHRICPEVHIGYLLDVFVLHGTTDNVPVRAPRRTWGSQMQKDSTLPRAPRQMWRSKMQKDKWDNPLTYLTEL
ncbi:PREDICTED: endogenous retrovirus group K member 18 Pol protein-like [Sturnus vulgaris]|uniref:endogenous retrovirus group K member 18 Pol protein-like n=1 Tax=Sturnus vulgaris TaxID=9172 RepID=UPI00071A88B6|nr:PREDICTED: endogenous retrovirus group K member 18 Pol protein-like [Sturnus vulgaris]